MTELIVTTPDTLSDLLYAAVRRAQQEHEETPVSPYMTAKEAAQYLRVGMSTLYGLAERGEVPSSKLGGKILFDRRQLDNHLCSD